MCLGIPMQVESVASASTVLCAEPGPGACRVVDVSLLERSPAAGDWLLVHIGIAIRDLQPAEAKQIADALRAVDAAARGEPFEHLIADLIEREPELPPHLRAGAGGGSGNG